MAWHQLPTEEPTDLQTYWVRTWWFTKPFQAVWYAASYAWLPVGFDPDGYVPWFVAPFYRDL